MELISGDQYGGKSAGMFIYQYYTLVLKRFFLIGYYEQFESC